MTRSDLVQISQAAFSLGVSSDELQIRAEIGALPEAVRSDTSWMIPSSSLASIAAREGWTLDLRGVQPRATTPTVSRQHSESMAAQAAVMLAKTQASAAWTEVQDLSRRLKVAQLGVETERTNQTQTALELAANEQELARLQRERAVAEARADELRRSLERHLSQTESLHDRLATLEAERGRLHQSLGWIGRRRFRRTDSATLDRAQTNSESTVTIGDIPPEGQTYHPVSTYEPVPKHGQQLGQLLPLDATTQAGVAEAADEFPDEPVATAEPNGTEATTLDNIPRLEATEWTVDQVAEVAPAIDPTTTSTWGAAASYPPPTPPRTRYYEDFSYGNQAQGGFGQTAV